jgi:poly(A) polymerase
MDRSLAPLAAAGIAAYEASFTALDAYRGFRAGPVRFALADCSLVDLAKAFDDLRYPGLCYADAALEVSSSDLEGAAPTTLYLRCADTPAGAESAAFAPLDLLRDPTRNVFLDPKAVYPSLRATTVAMRSAPSEEQLLQAAILLARQPYLLEPGTRVPLPRDFPVQAQRDLLGMILTGPTPERALGFLLENGFLERYWPELAELSGVSHSKDHHPEGDAWAHTLETFRHRKLPSLRLSLALLLHDSGKPQAAATEGRRFDRHAEIGRVVAERFMNRLGFSPSIVEDVSFLVRWHMMPAALPRLPLSRMEGVIDDPRFPILLELYKCDELSTFRGPDAYYEACAVYRAWLRNVGNPWRGPDGKKLVRMWLDETPRSVPKGLSRRQGKPRQGRKAGRSPAAPGDSRRATRSH